MKLNKNQILLAGGIIALLYILYRKNKSPKDEVDEVPQPESNNPVKSIPTEVQKPIKLTPQKPQKEVKSVEAQKGINYPKYFTYDGYDYNNGRANGVITKRNLDAKRGKVGVQTMITLKEFQEDYIKHAKAFNKKMDKIGGEFAKIKL